MRRWEGGGSRLMGLNEIPDVQYALSSGGVRIAYEVVGDGDVDVVFALGYIPNLEMSREVSFLRRWLERLTSFGRVAHYDRRGVGLSDRDLSMDSPEERMDDIRAVMDAAGMERAALVTSGDGGPIALMFAATYPDRVASLVLYQTWARITWAPDYPLGIEQPEEGSSYLHAREHWGDGTTSEFWVGDSWDPKATRALLARLERTNSSPVAAVSGACGLRPSPDQVARRHVGHRVPRGAGQLGVLVAGRVRGPGAGPGRGVRRRERGSRERVVPARAPDVMFTDVVDSTRSHGRSATPSGGTSSVATTQRFAGRSPSTVDARSSTPATASSRRSTVRLGRCSARWPSATRSHPAGCTCTPGSTPESARSTARILPGVAVHIAARVCSLAGSRRECSRRRPSATS